MGGGEAGRYRLSLNKLLISFSRFHERKEIDSFFPIVGAAEPADHFVYLIVVPLARLGTRR